MNKRFTKALFISAVTLCSISAVTAQNDKERAVIIKATNVNKLQELSAQFSEEFHKKKAEAFRMAKANNWETEIITPEGGMKSLIEVTEDGKPVYLTTHNAGSAITSRTNHLYPGGSLGLNLTGTGMIVGMWDGGYPRPTHVSFTNRYTRKDGNGSTAFHPTHVLGTLIGSGTSSGTNLPGRGMAYEATAWVCSYDNDASEMADMASQGLILSNHSYGLDATTLPNWAFGAYISVSKNVDDITFNAPYYQPCFSAGNDGTGNYDILTDRSLSKNGIAVAASSEVLNYTGPGSVGLASFSSWGPSDDKRVKPDIATKGLAVRSANSTTNTSYVNSQGTSMSCPGITGTLLLLQQHYKNLNDGNYMRSSTLRGLVAHSADEAGNSDGPDPLYGWGLMNAKKAAEIISGNGTTSTIQELTLMPGEVYTKQISVSGTQKVIATLAWTDPSGPQNNGTHNSTTPVLVNDLDITLTKLTDTYYPWKLQSNNNLPAEKGVNNVDNIEKVEINDASGDYIVTISHKGNTLRNPGGIPLQIYSLIISGIDAVAGIHDVKQTAFEVWPNPATDNLNVRLADMPLGNANVTIHDVQGRQVLSREMKELDSVFDVSMLNSGIYLVTVNNGQASETKKIIVK